MLLTITYSGQNTAELGYLLYKNPYRPQVFELSYGKAYVFYPEISDGRTTAALLLDIDPIELARGKNGKSGGGLFDYVNDRPYVSSSFMSTAISRVFGTALTGRADLRQALSDSALDLSATVTMLPCRGEQDKLNQVFEPLGYKVAYDAYVTDERFPQWGGGRFVNLTISGKLRLRDLLRHLYVLIPVFDRQKHYWVGEDEVEKLLRMGEGWLPGHPEKAYITGRYLKRRRRLVSMAFDRLSEANAPDGEAADAEAEADADETGAEVEAPGGNDAVPQPTKSLNDMRLESIIAALKDCGAKRIIDIGCGEGNLLRLLVKDSRFSHIAGADVSHAALEKARERLLSNDASDALRERLQLFQGSLTYIDKRFAGYDAACVVEVIEHLDAPRLAAFKRVLFGHAKPPVVIITTPNSEYNVRYELSRTRITSDAMPRGSGMRHADHRFEWTRSEFRDWAVNAAGEFGYSVEFFDIGDADVKYGTPTQMGVFHINER